VLDARPLVLDDLGGGLLKTRYEVAHNPLSVFMLRLIDPRRPVDPCCNHSAMHAALHVGMVSPSDGRTITRTSEGAGNGPAHQAQRRSSSSS